MFKEFKDFAMKGNVLDMAVGVIMGAAFAPIVNSLVKDVIMPPIGMLMGKVDFSALKLTIAAAQGENPAVTINYGVFINTVISFVITAFAIFLLVKAANKAKKAPAPAPAAPPPPSPTESLLGEIRDLLKRG
jgi:large conductance mechanosensitive channel